METKQKTNKVCERCGYKEIGNEPNNYFCFMLVGKYVGGFLCKECAKRYFEEIEALIKKENVRRIKEKLTSEEFEGMKFLTN